MDELHIRKRKRMLDEMGQGTDTPSKGLYGLESTAGKAMQAEGIKRVGFGLNQPENIYEAFQLLQDGITTEDWRKINISLARTKKLISERLKDKSFDCMVLTDSGYMRAASALLRRDVLEDQPQTIEFILW